MQWLAACRAYGKFFYVWKSVLCLLYCFSVRLMPAVGPAHDVALSDALTHFLPLRILFVGKDFSYLLLCFSRCFLAFSRCSSLLSVSASCGTKPWRGGWPPPIGGLPPMPRCPGAPSPGRAAPPRRDGLSPFMLSICRSACFRFSLYSFLYCFSVRSSSESIRCVSSAACFSGDGGSTLRSCLWDIRPASATSCAVAVVMHIAAEAHAKMIVFLIFITFSVVIVYVHGKGNEDCFNVKNYYANDIF